MNTFMYLLCIILCILKSVVIFIFLDIFERLINSKCMNVCGEKTPTASTLPINNEIDNDNSYVAKTSDLDNAPFFEGI